MKHKYIRPCDRFFSTQHLLWSVRTWWSHPPETFTLSLLLRELTFLLYKKLERGRTNTSTRACSAHSEWGWFEMKKQKMKEEKCWWMPESVVVWLGVKSHCRWRQHFCGYTFILPSAVIGTKSCSDANVWEISWWFIYCRSCTTERIALLYRHCIISHIFKLLPGVRRCTSSVFLWLSLGLNIYIS